MSIEVFSGPYQVPVKIWKFPGGEIGVKVEAKGIDTDWLPVIQLYWEGNDDLFALAQMVDIFRNAGVKEMVLEIPYFPYARQDRRCWPGEAHALKVVASFINSLNFDSVIVCDPHSTVLEALVDRLTVIPQEQCATMLPHYDFLIAPDAGAATKVCKHSQVQEGTKVLIAEKERDSCGKIVKSVINNPVQLFGKTACIVDDICDGGATFIELASVINDNGRPATLDLYVTHGIFSKGVAVLETYFDTIYVHNFVTTNPEIRNNSFIKEIF